jgi:ferredoxin
MPTVLAIGLGSQNSDLSFEVNTDEVIYEGLERQGLELPHGCLAGSCGACRIIIQDGIENLKAPSAVESDTINHIKNNLAAKTGDKSYLEKNIRLSCRARVLGNISFCKI